MTADDIQVKLTGSDREECLVIELPGGKIFLHSRAAIELHYKLGLALADWIASSFIDLIDHFNQQLGENHERP